MKVLRSVKSGPYAVSKCVVTIGGLRTKDVGKYYGTIPKACDDAKLVITLIKIEGKPIFSYQSDATNGYIMMGETSGLKAVRKLSVYDGNVNLVRGDTVFSEPHDVDYIPDVTYVGDDCDVVVSDGDSEKGVIDLGGGVMVTTTFTDEPSMVERYGMLNVPMVSIERDGGLLYRFPGYSECGIGRTPVNKEGWLFKVRHEGRILSIEGRSQIAWCKCLDVTESPYEYTLYDDGRKPEHRYLDEDYSLWGRLKRLLRIGE